MSTTNYINYFEKVKSTLDKLDLGILEKVVEEIIACRERQNFIYIFGNGGSAANASHIAGDFIKGISFELDKRFKVICLNDNMAGTTAISNDLSYDEVFIEQLKAFVSPGDLVIGISGSGNSVNVVKAMQYASESGAKTISLTGFKGGNLKEISDITIHVPINDMEISEDIHILIFHALKQEIIRRIKGDNYSMGFNYDQRVK